MPEDFSPSNGLNKSDKRYFPRWETRNRVLYRLESSSQTHEALTKDLSCAGASLSLTDHVRINQRIELTLFLPDQSTLKLEGKVLWVKSDFSNHREAGIIFHNTSEEAQEKILEYAFHIDKKKFVDNFFKGWNGKT